MQLPKFLVWYKKPEYRDIKEYSSALIRERRAPSPDGRGKTSIPKSLTLERVLANKTCSPLSLYDFYMYLKYIEFSPENLEFYIWFKNYDLMYEKNETEMHQKTSLHQTSLHQTSLHSSSTTTLANEQSHDDHQLMAKTSQPDLDIEASRTTAAKIEKLIAVQPCCDGNKCRPPSVRNHALSQPVATTAGLAAKRATPDFSTNPVWTQCAPYDRNRAELNAIVGKYLLPGAESELNIPPMIRDQCLSDLQTSSDPTYLRPVADHIYYLLKNCSHRNFIRLGVSNGTFETLCMATSLGIVLTLAGFLCIFLRAFTPALGQHTRLDVFAAWPLWWIGSSLIFSGLRGSCFFLLLFTRRQPLPWERFDDDASAKEELKGIRKWVSRMMIFDRKWKVQDRHLRRLQHKIIAQSMVAGAVLSSLGVILFIFLPIWSDTRA